MEDRHYQCHKLLIIQTEGGRLTLYVIVINVFFCYVTPTTITLYTATLKAWEQSALWNGGRNS